MSRLEGKTTRTTVEGVIRNRASALAGSWELRDIIGS
jgi:hypothetical protein